MFGEVKSCRSLTAFSCCATDQSSVLPPDALNALHQELELSTTLLSRAKSETFLADIRREQEYSDYESSAMGCEHINSEEVICGKKFANGEVVVHLEERQPLSAVNVMKALSPRALRHGSVDQIAYIDSEL